MVNLLYNPLYLIQFLSKFQWSSHQEHPRGHTRSEDEQTQQESGNLTLLFCQEYLVSFLNYLVIVMSSKDTNLWNVCDYYCLERNSMVEKGDKSAQTKIY